MEEERLWFELDKIAVAETSPGLGRTSKKGEAALNMMEHLTKPSPERCRQMYVEDGD